MDPRTVTPTLSPGVILGDLPTTKRVRDAMARVHARLGKLEVGLDAIRRDRTLNDHARAAAMHDLRAKVAGDVEPVLEAEYGRVQDALDGVERSIDERLYSVPTKTASREEIRRHVASLPDSRRAMFVRDRAKAGDLQTVAATLTAPSYLSGLDDDQQRALRDQIAQDLAPDLAAQRRELSAASSALQRAAKAFTATYVDRRPHATADTARARAEAVRAAEGA